MRDERLVGRPLIDDDAEVVELLDDGFDIAAEPWAVALVGAGGFGYSDYAAIMPRAGRESDERLRQIGGANLKLLAASAFGTEHGSLADGTGVGVRKGDAHTDEIHVDGEERIAPRAGFVNVDVHALGGERNLGELTAELFLIAF